RMITRYRGVATGCAWTRTSLPAGHAGRLFLQRVCQCEIASQRSRRVVGRVRHRGCDGGMNTSGLTWFPCRWTVGSPASSYVVVVCPTQRMELGAKGQGGPGPLLD